MKFGGPLLAVSDMAASKKFYEDILGQKAALDLGVHLSFADGFSLQQNYAELIGIDPATVLKNRTISSSILKLTTWRAGIIG